MVAQLDEALRCNREGRRFYSRWAHLIDLIFPAELCTLGWLSFLTDVVTRKITWSVKVAGVWD